MKIELVDQLAVQNKLGEGVIWDHRRQRIWWTDIDQCTLYRYDPVTKELESWKTPERLACFAPVHRQNFLVAAFASGFAYYQPETQALQWIKKIEADNPGTRMNDGRTDRQGRFWAGSMLEDHQSATEKGKLYCLHPDLSVTSAVNELTISNGLCWSPDSATLYHCDTPDSQINRYPFDSREGSLGAKSMLSQSDAGCFPDGSTVDAHGYIWNAQWGGSRVVRYAPDGRQDTVLRMPISQPTCVAFAGRKLDLLVVTSAWQGMHEQARAAEPAAGNLFVFQTECTGLAESEFKPDSTALFNTLT